MRCICTALTGTAAVGFIAYRTGRITQEGSKTIGNLLIYVSLPAVIIKGFLVERTAERMMGLLRSMAAAAVILLVCILVARLCFKKDVIAVGLVLFFSAASLPLILTKTLNFCAGLNTPLAMFAVGIYLAQCDFKKMLGKGKLYAVSAVRLLLIPLISLLLLTAVPAFGSDIRYAMLICAACPVGSNLAVYAQLHDKDYTYAVETVAVSTMLSIVTIPLLVRLADMLW